MGDYTVQRALDALADYLGEETTKVAIAAAAAGDNPIVVGVAGFRIVVVAYTMIAKAPVDVKWRSNAADRSGVLALDSFSGLTTPWVPSGHLETGVGEALQLNLSAAQIVGGHLSYKLREA